jgi:hypothetical protein
MISCDTVYQKVLALANKEQRGYITPQEFNLFADQAQMEIFEQYFYDLDQRFRVNSNSDEYANARDNIQEKITIFETNNTGSGSIVAADVYRLGTIKVQDLNYSESKTAPKVYVEAEEVQQRDLMYILQGPLTKPTSKRPIYVRRSSSITVYPNNSDFTYTYIRRPNKPNWNYVIVNNKPLYNASTSVNFELHAAEESELVYKILKLAGINIKQQEVVQVAQTLEATQVQQEKQ